ncbi:MAG: hypothetical protein HJJLKODD_01294 [Phycisphaerae bacterium]|nr:hypothetical protein [Phycisphaerae bacterium]
MLETTVMNPLLMEAVQRLGLTNRQSEIVMLLSKGGDIDALARELSISRATIQTHLARIYTRLKIRGRAELMSIILSDVLTHSPRQHVGTLESQAPVAALAF